MEELQSSNEEVQSANEELQSINEELETTKEELESTNEELITVNEETAHRNTELSRLNSDLLNLETSTHLGVVLLGRDLTIRRFSAQAEKQFNLTASDIGRPIRNIRHNLKFGDAHTAEAAIEKPRGSDAAPREAREILQTSSVDGLEALLSEVVANVRERECEVQDKEGRWYSLRARPYFALDNKVDGAVLVIVDITGLKSTERDIKVARTIESGSRRDEAPGCAERTRTLLLHHYPRHARTSARHARIRRHTVERVWQPALSQERRLSSSHYWRRQPHGRSHRGLLAVRQNRSRKSAAEGYRLGWRVARRPGILPCAPVTAR